MKRGKKNEIQTNVFIYGYIWRFFLHIKNTQFFPNQISTASMKFEHVSSNGNAPNEKGTPFLCWWISGVSY